MHACTNYSFGQCICLVNFNNYCCYNVLIINTPVSSQNNYHNLPRKIILNGCNHVNSNYTVTSIEFPAPTAVQLKGVYSYSAKKVSGVFENDVVHLICL